jgi:putative membrane-bound dehydrogenase-like protein
MPAIPRRAAWAVLALVCFLACLSPADDKKAPPKTGPATEKRFPPLKLPPGFTATLFACDPLIEYPSVIAAGPRPGTLFVAVDFMTGLGTEIVRRDEIRLIEDTDGDGYADRATVYADGFNSIQGLLYHDGALYVMHAPYLTVLRGTGKDGKAKERKDLLKGLGLAPEEDQIRLHNANGVVAGHDGWLYLALGDRGCDVKRPEGDRLVLHGGGVLRCRPDGRDLHVFSTGIRNVYDVALDEELNVFFRDNENDGGNYKIRVCHSFFGADHGYPYLYEERPDEALAPLADLGLGSSAGAACYLETQFPPEYRGKLLFCEWGRAVVSYPRKRAGSTFATAKEADFAAGAGNDPYGFKPTDLVVDYAGSLFVSDWADGQRPKRGRGRIYRIRYAGKEKQPTWPKEKALPSKAEDLVARLDSESHHERCRAQRAIEALGGDGIAAVEKALKVKGKLGTLGRLHAVWIIAKDKDAVENLFALAKAAPDRGCQAQAIRALADLADPVLTKHKLDAKAGDEKLAERLAAWNFGGNPRVLLQVVIALGRLRWSGSPAWLNKNWPSKPDAALAHAAQQALRQSGNWKAVLKLLDAPSSDAFRAIARRAVAEQYDAGLVDGLIERLRQEKGSARQVEYADALARVYKKPASPWTYWGFRPPPRPANTASWAKTDAIEKALNDFLASSKDRAARLETLRRLTREKVPISGQALGAWLKAEGDAATVAALLEAMRGRPGGETRADLEGVLQDNKQTAANRLLAAATFVEGLDAKSEGRLLAMAKAVEDGPVLAALLRAAGAREMTAASELLLGKLSSKDAEVRACAVEALAGLALKEAHEPIQKALDDPSPKVRAAAALSAGKLSLRPASARLLKLARDGDADVRRASLEALRLLREPKALPVAVEALNDAETTEQALDCVAVLGGPANAAAVADLAKRRPSGEVLALAGKTLAAWAARDNKPAERAAIEKAFAEVHGDSGVMLGWHVRGPISDADAVVKKLTAGKALPTGEKPGPGWKLTLASGLDARVRLGPAKGDGAWIAYGEATLGADAKVDCFTTGSSAATVWLNGKVVHRRDRPAVPGPYPERFKATLAKGVNRVVVRLDGVKGSGEFSLRFRRVSSEAARERLALASLSRAGNPENGRKVFLDVEKSLCLKCHRVEGVRGGERIGPDLTGLGSRFSKAYVVESILEPSRTVSPSYESSRIVLKSGRTLTGIRVAQTDATVTLADGEGKKHEIARDRIERIEKQAGSTMPDGLEKRLSEDEFVDLVSFLMSLRKR